MRPRSEPLREAYRAAAAKLKEEDQPINQRTLATKLNRKYAAVRKFLRCNPEFTQEIGISINRPMRAEDYAAAAAELSASGQRVTRKALACKLGRNRKSVERFYLDHPELVIRPEVIPRKAQTIDKSLAEHLSVVEVEEAPRWKKGQEISVSYWNEQSGRMALKPVRFAEYIALWDKGLLKFQQERAERPSFLPSREEASALI